MTSDSPPAKDAVKKVETPKSIMEMVFSGVLGALVSVFVWYSYSFKSPMVLVFAVAKKRPKDAIFKLKERISRWSRANIMAKNRGARKI